MNLSTIRNLILFDEQEIKGGFTVSYEYDIYNRIVKETYSDGRVFKYTYVNDRVECERDDGTVHQVVGVNTICKEES